MPQDNQDTDPQPPGDLPEKGTEHVGAETAREGGLLQGFRGMADVQSARVGEAARTEDLDVRPQPRDAHASLALHGRCACRGACTSGTIESSLARLPAPSTCVLGARQAQFACDALLLVAPRSAAVLSCAASLSWA